jgi:NAD+ synthase
MCASFNRQALTIDTSAEVERICLALTRTVRKRLRRKGAIVGISGGVDSAVVLALCVRSFGPQRVRAVIMPERDSAPESEALARLVAAECGLSPIVEEITGILEAFRCYERRDEAIRRAFPEYDTGLGYRAKITLPPNLLEKDTLNIFSLTVISADGKTVTKKLSAPDLYQIIAASNIKQRTRMGMLYYYAELHNFAVIGTANKNEDDLGFFVKYGDGGIDVKPIAHLYKTQVYQLAEFFGIPELIRQRVPTTDTYNAGSTQEEFFFRLPFETMDLLWHGMESHAPLSEVAEVMNLSEPQVVRAYNDLVRKRRTSEYLKLPPIGLGRGPGENLTDTWDDEPLQ